LFIARLHPAADGGNTTLEFFTGYVIEKSLSVDNVFLFVLIFGALAVPKELQHRVLFYGVVGAIVMRTVLIFTGAALIARFDWILYLFGAFLVYTGIKTWLQKDEHPDVSESKLLKRVRQVLPTTDGYRGDHFWVRENGKLLATPMFVVLILVEFTDLIFAMDSIPAIFAITRDPFIILTSNVFAILGLRALYFLLAGVADKLRYLKAGLAIILGFVGVKLLLESLVHDGIETIAGIPLPEINPLVSLGIIMGILAVVTVLSLRRPMPKGEQAPAGIAPPFEEASTSTKTGDS
ncbi:MAG: TerC family protein, partial [Actinomycetota bacterium]|nr:TerC family protein [Actinomycetota bacterium]